MTNKAIQNKPILTLSGINKPMLTINKEHPTLVLKKTKKDSVKSVNTSTEKTGITTAKTAKITPSPKAKTEAKTETKLAADYNFYAIYKQLHTQFPNIINMDKPVLLAITIRKKMLEKVDAPNKVLYKWIKWYFRKSNYYAEHKIGAIRYNLDGTEAGKVTEQEQAKRDQQIEKMQIVTSNPNTENLESTTKEEQKTDTAINETIKKEQ